MRSEVASADLSAAARQYLAEQLPGRDVLGLALAGSFDERVLTGEGRTQLWAFELEPAAALASTAGTPVRRFYAAVGQTTPNYFPAYGLQPDDAYSFHVGTRFMLEMRVALVDPSLEPTGAREGMRNFVSACNPGVPITGEQLAALFRCAPETGATPDEHGERFFAVYRLTLRGKDVYCLGADCPPGFYELTQYPPQVALRLHLGKLIRTEARRDAAIDE